MKIGTCSIFKYPPANPAGIVLKFGIKSKLRQQDSKRKIENLLSIIKEDYWGGADETS